MFKNRGLSPIFPEYIEPVVRTDYFETEKLTEELKPCTEKDVNQLVLMPEGWESTKGMSAEEVEGAASAIYHGTANFKIYKLKLFPAEQDHGLFVYYAEAYYSEEARTRYQSGLFSRPYMRNRVGYYKPLPAETGMYKLIDGKTCEEKSTGTVNTPFDYSRWRPMSNFNAIIRYKGRPFVYDFFYLGDDFKKDYVLNLMEFRQDRPDMVSVCRFQEKKRDE